MSQQYQKQKKKWIKKGREEFAKEVLEEIDKLHNKLEKEYYSTTGALRYYKLTYEDLLELKKIIKQKAGEIK